MSEQALRISEPARCLFGDGGGNPRPLVHLDASQEFVAAVSGEKNRRFPLLHVEPILPERRDDIGLMCDDDRIGMVFRRHGKHLAKGFSSSIVLIGRHDQSALGQVRRFLNLRETGNDRRLVSPVILAGINPADGHPGLTKSVTKGLRQSLALVVKIALRGNVVEF